MIPHLTPGGYAQTKTKLENLERRLTDLEARTDLSPLRRLEVRRLYESMIRQYRREMRLYEACSTAVIAGVVPSRGPKHVEAWTHGCNLGDK